MLFLPCGACDLKKGKRLLSGQGTRTCLQFPPLLPCGPWQLRNFSMLQRKEPDLPHVAQRSQFSLSQCPCYWLTPLVRIVKATQDWMKEPIICTSQQGMCTSAYPLCWASWKSKTLQIAKIRAQARNSNCWVAEIHDWGSFPPVEWGSREMRCQIWPLIFMVRAVCSL